MPSFATVFSLLAAVSATAFAGAVGGVEADLSKRAPSWGNKGNNIGAKCWRDKNCYDSAPLAKAFCNKRGRCDYQCPHAYVKDGNNGCQQTCTYDHNCYKNNLPRNSHPVCLSRKCEVACNDGYHWEKNGCVKDTNVCYRYNRHGAKILPGTQCDVPEDGFTTCDKWGKCVPQCDYKLGYELFTNDDGQLKCINVKNDPWNCGSPGNVCSPGYNGLGKPICWNGNCSLNCHGYGRPMYLPNGQVYCSSS